MSTATLPQIWSFGHPLDTSEDKFGILRDSSDAATDFAELRRRFDTDGYLYMKGYLDREQVLDARASLTDGLAEAGVLDENFPRIDGICKPGAGYVFKPELTNNNAKIQDLLYSGRLPEFYRQFYGEEIRHYDFTWLRAIGPGKGTNPHCDLPYMGRGTHGHMTCWLPYGDISFELGGLMVLEGSHKRMDLLENYVYNPPVLRNKFGGRWLTAEFEPGDFITFGMFLVHASLDNRTENRLRISSDARYQRASEPIDDRWIGVNPPGHTTAGKRGRIC
jgi:hypothetical protein